MRSDKTCLLAATFILGAAGTASAQLPTVILREADAIGPPGHVVTFINNPDANNVGGIATTLSTSDGTTTLSHVWGDPTGGTSGTLLLTEANGVAGYDQTAFESFFGMDDLGNVCVGPSLVDLMTMTSGIDAVWVNSTPVLNEGDNPLSEPLLVSVFNSRPNIIKGTGEPVWVGGLDDMGGVDQGRRLYRGVGHTIVQTAGPAPAPLVANISNSGVGFDFRFSAMGSHYINDIDTDLPTSMDSYVVIDGALAMTSGATIIGEGESIPASSGGLAGETWTNFDSFGINEAGDFMITGNTSGASTATDEFVSFNGNIILREGDTVMDLASTSYTLAGAIDMAAMNEQGDMVVVWDVDTSGNEAVLINGVVVLKEGDEVDWDNDGTIDAGHVISSGGFGGIAASTITPRIGGVVRAYVTADVDVPGVGALEGLICIEFTPVEDFPSLCNGDGGDQMGCTDCPCGNNATAGTIGGCINSATTSARLSASGDASVSLPASITSDLRFAISGAPPSAFCILNSGDNVAPQGMANPCFGLNSGAQSATFDGLRCAVGNTLRHGGRSADVNGDVGVTNNPWGGEGGPAVGIAQQGAGFASGQTRYFQVINRDDPLAVCTRGLNTSQAVEVTFEP